MTMREWLEDIAPIWTDENGEIQSALPYREIPILCPVGCGRCLVLIAGLYRCPDECPVIAEWVHQSSELLNKVRSESLTSLQEAA